MTFLYDGLGRPNFQYSPTLTDTFYTYRGRTTQVKVDAVDRDPQITTTLVNVKGQTIKVWNADNVPATLHERGEGMARPSIEFILDGFGRMTETKTWQGGTNYLSIKAEYDALGRQTRLIDPDKGTWNYIYNANGDLTRQQDANGSVTTFSYDRLRRQLTRVTTAAAGNGGGTETTSWYYWGASSGDGPQTVHDNQEGWIGAVQRELLVASNQPGLGGYNTEKIDYYDARGRRYMDLHLVDGKWFYRHRTFDGSSRLITLSHYWRPPGFEGSFDSHPEQWRSFTLTNTYDSRSYLTQVREGSNYIWWEAGPINGYDYLDRPVFFGKGRQGSNHGNWTEQWYDDLSGLLRSTNTGYQYSETAAAWEVQRNTYQYDGLDNLKFREDLKRGVTETFQYDQLNRLTHIGGTPIATYATNGNILSKSAVTAPGSRKAYSYGNASHPHAVTSAHGITLSYDANGNVLKRTEGGRTTAIRWAGFDKPRWMLRWLGTSANTAVGSAFQYGPDRQRIVNLKADKLVRPGNTSDTTLWYPSHFKEKKLYVGESFEVDYVNESSGGVNWSMDAVRIYIPAPGGNAGAITINPNSTNPTSHERLLYHYDHLGSIHAITNFGQNTPGETTIALDDANRKSLYNFDPWGQRRDPGDWLGWVPNANYTRAGNDDLTPRGYTGHEMMDDLGLVHMNGRIYDPLLGRFLSADIVVDGRENLQGYNRYSYVKNNPLTYTDPSGYTTGQINPFWQTFFAKALLGDKAAAETLQFQEVKRQADAKAGMIVLESQTPYGDYQDALVLKDSNATWWQRGLAAGSLFLNAITVGRAPNAGPILRNADELMEAAADGTRVAGDAANRTTDAARTLNDVDFELAPNGGQVDSQTFRTPEGYPGEGMTGIHQDHAVPQSLDPSNPAIQSSGNLQDMPAAMNSVDKMPYDVELKQRFQTLVDDLESTGMSREEARAKAYFSMETEIRAHSNSLPARTMDPVEIDRLEPM